MAGGGFAGAPSLAGVVQAWLAGYYGIESSPPVDAFVRTTEGREVLLVREQGGELEIALELPAHALSGRPSFDALCQLVEGVSHFVLVVERARRGLPTTQLELELQAEVDKFVTLLAATRAPEATPRRAERSSRLRERLFREGEFLHPRGTELGDRYRLATDLAARFSEQLERRFVRSGRLREMRAVLRRFHAAGQADKLTLAEAA